MKKMTLEEVLAGMRDRDLLNIQEELLSGIVPTTGYAHGFCRKVNRMIDAGEMCINQSSYRRVYLPSLAKAVRKELARRYTLAVTVGVLQADAVLEATRPTSQFPGQISLALEVTT